MLKNKKIYLTEEGLQEKVEELNFLKKEKRPSIINAIKEARALGDLSENAEYHAAREEQAQIESKIAELEEIIESATIITIGNFDTVSIGCSVKIKYVEDDEVEDYKIVGSSESDPLNNKISNESPIANAIINCKKGDIVTVESPSGAYKVQILEIA